MDHDAVTGQQGMPACVHTGMAQAHELFPTTAQTGLAAWTVPVTISGLDITPTIVWTNTTDIIQNT